jgi:hypothetical protein
MDVMSKKKPDDTAGDQHRSNRLVRLPESLHEAIAGLAKEAGRPVTWEVRMALLAWLRQKGRPIPPDLE